MGGLDTQCEGEWGHSQNFRTCLVDIDPNLQFGGYISDDHPNVVQMTQLLINLSYVAIIEPNS